MREENWPLVVGEPVKAETLSGVQPLALAVLARATADAKFVPVVVPDFNDVLPVDADQRDVVHARNFLTGRTEDDLDVLAFWCVRAGITSEAVVRHALECEEASRQDGVDRCMVRRPLGVRT